MYNPYYGNPMGGKLPPTLPVAVKKMPAPLPTSLHEMQLKELQAQPFNQRMTLAEQQTAPLPSPVTSVQWRGVFDSTLYLDSANKNSTNGIVFDSLQFQVKPLNNQNDLSNITHIKVPAFYFPRLNPVVGKPDPYYEKRVMMLIEEIPSTAAVGTAALNQFHFEFAVTEINSVAIQLVPLYDTIYFQVPIQTMSSITLSFLRPPYFTKITMPPDVITVIMLPPNPTPGAPPGPYVYTVGVPVKFAFTNDQQWYALSSIDVAANPPAVVVPGPPYVTFPLPTAVATWTTGKPTSSTVINDILAEPLGNFISTVGNPIRIPATGGAPAYYAPYGYFEMTGLTEDVLAPTGIIFPPIDPAQFPGFIPGLAGIPITFQIRKNRIAFQMRFSALQGVSTNGLIATHT